MEEKLKKIKEQFELRKAWITESENHRKDIVSTKQSCNNERGAFDMAFRIVEEILKPQPHYHVAGDENIDTCKMCGLDIRNSIHIRL